MSVPNIGPDHFDQGDPDAADGSRRGNPAPLYRDETVTDDVTAASTRASAVTHRFGGVRYALTRPDAPAAEVRPATEGGGSDSVE
jgi:hypothetical protein